CSSSSTSTGFFLLPPPHRATLFPYTTLFRSYNTQRLSVNFRSGILFPIPAAAFYLFNRLWNITCQSKHQAASMLGRGNGIAIRGIHNKHASSRCSRYINIVYAYTGTPHYFQIFCSIQEPLIYGGGTANNDTIIAFYFFIQLLTIQL